MTMPMMSSSTLSARSHELPEIAGPGRYLCFGPFHIDVKREELFKDGARVRIPSKVYQVLMALLDRPGEVVTRENLRARLWPVGTFVNYDANVNTTVNKLRQALGDSSDQPLYIETIPRKGYCLLVQPEVSDKSPHSPLAHSQPSADSAPESSRRAGGLVFSRSDIAIVLGVIGLILAGMLLGAGITRLWISHAVPVFPYPLATFFSHSSATALF